MWATTNLSIPILFGISLEVYIILAIIGIISFWIFYRILEKRQIIGRRKVLYSAILALTVSPAIYIIGAFLFFWIYFFPPEFQEDFDEKKWHALKELRFEMRDDIIESKLLTSETKLEVVELLGKPEYGYTTNLWKYDLGTSGAGFGWQFNYLEIVFKEDTVFAYHIEEIID